MYRIHIVQHFCSRMLESSLVGPVQFLSLDSGNFVNPSYTWEVLSVVWRYLWPLTSLVLSFLSLSPLLTFFCLLKERGLFLYLLTLTAGCAVTLFQRLSSEDLPYWALAFEGSLGEVLCSLLTLHVLRTHCCTILLLLYFHYTRHPTLQKLISGS